MRTNRTYLLLLLLLQTLLFHSSAMAQTNYDNLWKSIEKLENDGKTKDALVSATSILDKAKTEHNTAQVVKASIYTYKYKMILEENSELSIVNDLKLNIQSTSGAEKAILQSILAELYWQYYNSNSWKFSNRTETKEKQSDDFRTWDLTTLFKEINTYYLASLQDKTLLQQTSLEGIKPILEEQKNSKIYRPTLYDLLAHRALSYFNDDKSDIVSPANAFAIDNKNFFSKASDFIQLPLKADDENSNDYLALKIYQDLLKFRLNDKANMEALADVDLMRLKYVRDHYFNKSENENLYFDALWEQRNAYLNAPAGTQYDYELATFIQQKTDAKEKQFFETKAIGKNGMKDAIAICDEAIKRFPESEGAKNCAVVKENIFSKNLSLTTEETAIPNTKFLALVDYKNVSKIYLKIVPVDYKEVSKIFDLKTNETQNDIINRINAMKAQKTWEQSLPGTADFENHTTEIKIEGLNKGFYLLVASTNKNFTAKLGQEAVAVTQFWSSQIAFVTRDNNNEKQFEVYVLDRNNGQPLAGADVKFYRNEYDYNSRKYKRTELGTVKTDANGFCKKAFSGKNNNYYYNSENYQFEISYKGDFLPSERSYYSYYYPKTEEPKEIKTVHLFTDRSIYRPGQTIYFKGILTKRMDEKHSIVSNEKVKVTFKDVNDQDITSQEFTTNEYGSFTGIFTAPLTGLMGSMALTTDHGSVSVQVEEYKRPKFEVTFDTIKKSYNLNDKVRITGKALAYSGANVDGAEVKYTVTRKAQIPFWCWWGWRKPWFPTTPEKIIAVGTTTTDANGSFTIDFDAIPDLTLSKELKPYFTYEVSADVVDITGETHNGNTSVRVGYLAIDADITVPNELDFSKENKLYVSTNNLNGQPEPTDVIVKIYDMAEPANPKRTKLWEQPDQFVLSKTDYAKDFPYDIYDNEDNADNWQKLNLAATYSFNTGKQKEIILKPNMLMQGAYRVELYCKDKNGNEINIPKSFNASSIYDKTLNPKQFLSFNIDSTIVSPKETLRYQIGSSMQNAFAVVEVAFKGKVLDKKFITLNNEIKSFSFPVTEAYRGGLDITYTMVNKNRNYSGHETVTVPYENKELEVEWLTYRDKMLPGSKEQWKLKLKGPNKEKITAELLASMYDASLDAFLPHFWNFSLSQSYYTNTLNGFTSDCFSAKSSNLYTSKKWNPSSPWAFHNYDGLNLFGLHLGNYYGYYGRGGGKMYMSKASAPMMLESANFAVDAAPEGAIEKGKEAYNNFGNRGADENLQTDTASATSVLTKPEPPKPQVTPRTNLKETAFFFPQLQTDSEGNVIINFEMPEALTRWKFMGLALTKDLYSTVFEKEVVTQKELMVVPNAPRFLREGDKFSFSAKITNLSASALSGMVALTIKDALTGKEINTAFKNLNATKMFAVAAGANTPVSWDIEVPQGVSAITYEVVAQAGNFSDGESAPLIVLPNRMLVTETLPLWVSGKSKKTYTFSKLLNNKSNTLKNYSLTLEMTSQPVWYAIQALPYMIEYPYECAEQLFSRYYANTLASHIANANPDFKKIYEKWSSASSDALLSNLEKNQDLKSVLLEETPWVRYAQNETEQKKRVALLFDLNKMAAEQQAALKKLRDMQTPNGGFTWFPGMQDNRFITQHIVAGIGHLEKLGVLNRKESKDVNDMTDKAVAYLNARLKEDLENIKKWDKDYLKNNHLDYSILHTLYALSFFSPEKSEAYTYFIEQGKKYWLDRDLYSKAMLALILQRNSEKASADKIITALKQNSIENEELGMYWKANESGGWYWYQAPVETQALLIEAFHEVAKDEKSVDEMKVWLLKQKQTTAWKSTKATAEACYALLLQGSNWVKSDNLVEVTLNKIKVEPQKMDVAIEPGTGYYKVKWSGDAIKPEMGKIEIKKTDKGPAWGAMYWQYFEDLDKITSAETNLKLTKKLFKKVQTAYGLQLQEITAQTPLNPGDLVTVRIELRTDRNMEYVHLKDMRAAGFEPVNVLSQYKWQDGLGYYESTKDVATHFFMDWMNKGIYVFEYDVRATLAGNFSNGITSIECMYAPEFTSHSKGERVTIMKK